VPLQCLSVNQCPSGANLSWAEASVLDVDALALIETRFDPNEVDLRIGYLMVNIDPEQPGNVFTSLGQLPFDGSLFWKGDLRCLYMPGSCPGLLVTRSDLTSFPVLSCEGIPWQGTGWVVAGYFVDPQLGDRMLSAAGLTRIPDDGLMLGRVLFDNGTTVQPVEGAFISVFPRPPALEVAYLSADLSNASPDGPTSSSGYFILHPVPSGSAVSASATVDGI